jgi:AcrR family transcriptional regulator
MAATGGATAPRERISRDDILDIARRQFAQNGYRGTNLGQVSDELGVTRQAIYYYFPKKHDVLAGLFERFFAVLESAVETAAASEGEPGARFGAMLRAHVETVASDPELSSVFLSEGHGNLPPAPAAAVQSRRKAYNDKFVQAYTQGVAAGQLAGDVRPRVAVGLLLGAANWVFRWYDPKGRMTPTEFATMAERFLATGFGAKGSSRRK